MRICSQKLIRNRDAPLDEFLAGSPRIVCHRYAGDDHTNEDTSAIEFLGASEHDLRLLSIDHAKVHFPIHRLSPLMEGPVARGELRSRRTGGKAAKRVRRGNDFVASKRAKVPSETRTRFIFTAISNRSSATSSLFFGKRNREV